jgi:hypothetical protein
LENSKGEQTPAGMLTTAEIDRLIAGLRGLHPFPLEAGVSPEPHDVRTLPCGRCKANTTHHDFRCVRCNQTHATAPDLREHVCEQLSVDPHCYD